MDAVDIEVFATGEWGGQKWTVDHLDAMVANFAKTNHAIKPMVKLGHSDRQVLAQKDGQPALGWIAGLRRVGQKLIATVQDMPVLLRDLLKARRYDRVSAEIYPKAELTTWEENLKTGVTGPVLSGFALLGADVPEVKTLEDLHRVLACEVQFSEPTDGAVSLCAVMDDPMPIRGARRLESAVTPPRESMAMADKNAPESKVDVDALTAQLEAEKAERVKLSAQVAELTELKAAASELKAAVAKLTEQNKALETQATEAAARAAMAETEKQAELFIARNQAKDAYRITPAMVPAVKALYCRLGTDVTVTGDDAKAIFGETKTEATDRDLLEALIAALPKVALGEVAHATGGGDSGARNMEKPGEFAELVKATAAKHGLDLQTQRDQAVRLTLRENPDIANRYRAGRA